VRPAGGPRATEVPTTPTTPTNPTTATAPGGPGTDTTGATANDDKRHGDHARGRRHQATPANPNPNCSLDVPPDPLSARGLATPYRLHATDPRGGECHETDANQSAFVEATILDPATGRLSVYRPLVIDRATRPAADPVAPALPAGAVVGVWFGYNGDVLTLGGPGARGCVNGTPGSPFGQFAHCGGDAFFRAAQASVAAGRTPVPALGTAADGQTCPSVRDFAVVDQDQSDNLATAYLATPDGRTAQRTAATAGALAGARTISNPSDNGLLATAMDPALGCRPFTAPDLTDGGRQVPSLALNELQAAAHQPGPVALIPLTNPMAQVDGRNDPAKADLYRAGVDQPLLAAAAGDGARYCQHLVDVAPTRLALDRGRLAGAASPDPAAGTNLFTFLAQRLQASYQNLGCGGLIRTPNPVTVQRNGDGVATDATLRH
jgi:hypothetical protein